MKKTRSILFLLISGLVAGQAMATDAWRWRERGIWVYGDKYPRGADSLEKVSSASGPATAASAVGAAANAAKLFPVTLYGMGCPGCEAAKKALDERKVPYSLKDPSKPEVYDEFKKLSPQSMAPVITVGDKALVGFDPAALNGSLDDAGYDKAASPRK